MSHEFTDGVEIDAPIDTVWAVYSDVERWPEWTASVDEVRFVEGDRVALEARARIRQPKLRTFIWTVTAVEPGRSWTWEARGAGIRTTGVHTLEPIDAARTRVRQAIVHHGPLAGLASRMYARLTRRYLAMEAAGLKARSEAHARA